MADKGYKKAGRKYWLKMRDDFFQLKHIRMMRKKSCDYVVAYQQMMVSTIKTDGIFEYHPELFDSLADEIAEHIDMDVHIVDEVFRILKAYKLVEIYAGGCMFIEAVENTDSESESAQRVREHRERLKKGLHCNGDVTNCNDIKEEDKEEKQEDKEEKQEDKEQQKADSWAIFIGRINDVIPKSKFQNPEKCRELLETRIEETGLTAEELGNCFWKFASDYQKSDDFAKSRWQFFPQVERALGIRYTETLKPHVAKKVKAKKAQQKQVEEAEDEHIDLWGED